MSVKSKCMSLLLPLYNELNVFAGGADAPRIMTIQETLEKILNEQCSLCRFGDGEFKWMLAIPQNSFQQQSDLLKDCLQHVLRKRDKKFLIALPPYFGSLLSYNAYAIKYWGKEMSLRRKRIYTLLDSSYEYGNLNVTRFYMDYRDKGHVLAVVKKWRDIFRGRKIVIIEGEYSRLGVGNDLLAQATACYRIICPAVNAFRYRREILQAFLDMKFAHEVLVILALGPTATVLSAELFDYGYQVIDIEHIDVEYMWSLMRAKYKVPVKGRWVNEAGGIHEELEESVLTAYRREIVCRVGID